MTHLNNNKMVDKARGTYFLIEKQEDGNYKGITYSNNLTVEVRDIDPQTVLVRLLTHE